MKEYKVLIVGDGGVGTTSCVLQLVCGLFEEYDMDMNEEFEKVLEFNDEPCLLHILGDSRTSEFSLSHEAKLREYEGFIIMFSLIDRDSFNNVTMYKTQINRLNNDMNTPIILVGNKCDLTRNIEVENIEINDICIVWGCKYVEISARENINVEKAFITLIEVISKSFTDRNK